MFKFGLLVVGLVAAAYAGPVAFKGRENVFDYSVTVGREVDDSGFQQGFVIQTKVIARARADGSWNLRVSLIK